MRCIRQVYVCIAARVFCCFPVELILVLTITETCLYHCYYADFIDDSLP